MTSEFGLKYRRSENTLVWQPAHLPGSSKQCDLEDQFIKIEDDGEPEDLNSKVVWEKTSDSHRPILAVRIFMDFLHRQPDGLVMAICDW